MKVKFTTNINKELLDEIKIQAIKDGKNVNEIIESQLEKYLKKGGVEMLRDRFEKAVQREYECTKKTMDDNLRLVVVVDGVGWDELDEFQDWLTSEGHSWEMSGDVMFIITNSEV